ncbi:hypothetical protein MACH09_03370 [Vibrio sp. MACH09]|uniref:hypothetical protein n=1 Tax=Vibrio sp. MACH09 TaxID=3025122 RepID=UPI002793D4DF|nr:hypothetical protein [Vibrio sp. MACH09]GLO59829.1 hypothetical protein MACH09_03370 [Vibrio sp. MACH09]
MREVSSEEQNHICGGWVTYFDVIKSVNLGYAAALTVALFATALGYILGSQR